MSAARALVIDLAPLRTGRAFRSVFAARLVSLLGIGLLVVAVPAQVYGLTGSTGHVAGVAAVTAVALFAGSIGGGVLADARERRRVIQVARTVAGLAFVVLGVNALAPEPSLVVLYVAAAVDGAAGGVSGAALMAVIPTIVPREQLAAAGALVALTTDLGTIAAPAIAGLLIASGGVAVTYFVAAAATAVTVGLVHGIGESPAPAGRSAPRTLGLRFAAGHPIVRGTLLVGVLAMLAGGAVVLLPAYVDQVLGAGPSTLGLLYAAPAAGALLATLTSGWTGQLRRTGLALLAATVVTALGLVVLGVAGTALVAFLGLAGHGLGRALTDVLRFAMLQEHTPPELRGRVSGLWQVQVLLGTSVGSPAAGLLGGWLPPDAALLTYAVACLVLTALAAAALRPVWRTVSA